MRSAGRAAWPAEHDGSDIRHGQAKILSHPRRQGWNLPPVGILVDVVTAADAVRIGKEVDGAQAPVLRCQRLGQPDIYRGVLIRLRSGESTERTLHFRDRHAVRIARRILAHRRKENVLVLRHRLVKKFVRVQPEGVGLKEHDVKDDGARLLGFDAVHHLAMHGARPRPAPCGLHHSFQTWLVSGDNHYIGIGLDLAGLSGNENIGETGFGGSQPVQPVKFEESRDGDCGEQQD